MVAHVEDPDLVTAPIEDVALPNLSVHVADAGALGGGTDDPTSGLRADRRIPACVIGVPVGVQDVGEPPTLRLESAQDALG
jgi:hypothetical protein